MTANIEALITAMEKATIQQDRQAALYAFDTYAATIDAGLMLSVKRAREAIRDYADAIRMGNRYDGPVATKARGKALAALRALGPYQ